ncbi:MAG: DegT/DnrJ/EryC1/StrS family aminotransferase [Gammaproteobacteria bacterium]
MPFIDLRLQQAAIREQLQERMAKVLAHGQYILGPEVYELEETLAAFAGVKHCVTLSSGTDALFAALLALDVSWGDEVITSPFSFIAPAEAVALLGAIPVFVDIDPRTYNLDPALLQDAITPRTRAIIAVSLYGQCAELDPINAIAARHGIPVVEDAAQSFGALYKGRRSCSLTHIGCTSFFPSKPLGCYGDGGACLTDDEKLALALRQIRDHGQEGRYQHRRLGINGRMDTLQAAVVLAKLEAFPDELGARSRIATCYDELLRTTRCVTPYVEPYNSSAYAQYTIQVGERDRVQEALKQAGVPTAVHYPSTLEKQSALAGVSKKAGEISVAEKAASHVLSLPMHPYLTEQELFHIVQAVAAATNRPD